MFIFWWLFWLLVAVSPACLSVPFSFPGWWSSAGEGFNGPVSLRSQPAVSSHARPGSDPHTARVRSVSESTGACESTPAAGDCKRELLPRAAPRSQRWHSGIARQGHSRVRVAQVADAMRVTAAVAPRVASGDPAASKGKSAGGASFGKRRVGREERCAATHARFSWP